VIRALSPSLIALASFPLALAKTLTLARSVPMRNSGGSSPAATVCPASMFRATTIPSQGASTSVLPRAVSAAASAAWRSAAAASARVMRACACATALRDAWSALRVIARRFESAILRSRSARAAARLVWFLASSASAAARAACSRWTSPSNGRGSSFAQSWPCATFVPRSQ
jgi:hypothetical protein